MAAQAEMTNYDPGRVLFGGGGSQPYVTMNAAPAVGTSASTSTSNILGPESVRATGAGPFDSAYRQNLATYAGGQFFRPTGSLSFDPTGNLFGSPTGGGNDPVIGTGESLFGRALGGNPFSFAPPAPPVTEQQPDMFSSWQDWIEQFREQGRGYMPNLQ